MDVAVIGSGFSGFSAAHALVAKGHRVTVLDVGETLDERRSAAVARLREAPPKVNDEGDDFRLISRNATVVPGQLPKKMFFGSEDIYAGDRPFAHTASLVSGRAPFPTFTKGGFSNIWGAAALAVDACDMADWPVSRAEMEPYFRAAAQLMPLAGGAGTLSQAFPAYRDGLGDIDPGPQGQALLADLQRAEPRLQALGTLYGKARLAIHTTDDSPEALACNGCGQCFVGCVRGAIFATVPKLDDMARRGQIAYRTGVYVGGIEEQGGKVAIAAVDLRDNRALALSFDAAFVAAGPINTTRLLLRSRRLYDQVVSLRESQKFVVPMLRRRAAKSGIEHPAVTLASVFLETKVAGLSDHWVHVQVVPMNDMILAASGLPGANQPAGRAFYAWAMRRMMMGWCGMHSDHSSRVELRLRQGTAADPERLEIDVKVSDTARDAARAAAKDLFRKGLKFGTLFCYNVLKFSNPGSGTHCGASFPMTKTPTRAFDSDVLGRPFGWTRVFVVDSSVLPSIPGTTLAFSAMANAYRIASLAPV